MKIAISGVVLSLLMPLQERAGVAATLLVIGYLAASLPHILVGALMPTHGLLLSTRSYPSVLLGLCLMSWVALRWQDDSAQTTEDRG